MKRYQKNNKRQIIFRVSVAVLLVGVCAVALGLILPRMNLSTKRVASGASSIVASATDLSSGPESKSVQKPVSITILGAGDDLIHDVIYQQAQKRAGGSGYDFKPVYERVADVIKSADISVINQETPLAGKIAAPSGYPRFNSPTQVGDELINLGFDVINHANNHGKQNSGDMPYTRTSDHA